MALLLMHATSARLANSAMVLTILRPPALLATSAQLAPSMQRPILALPERRVPLVKQLFRAVTPALMVNSAPRVLVPLLGHARQALTAQAVPVTNGTSSVLQASTSLEEPALTALTTITAHQVSLSHFPAHLAQKARTVPTRPHSVKTAAVLRIASHVP
jgi:hypothetical protein